MVSCMFANDTKEYLVVGTAYVREDVSEPKRQTFRCSYMCVGGALYVSRLADDALYGLEVGVQSLRWEHLVFSTFNGPILIRIHPLLWAGM